MPAQTINVNELRDILANVKHAMPVTIATFTDARCRKTANPFSEVRKLSRINGFVGADYQKAVNRQEMREGVAPTFQAQARKWGSHVEGTPLIEHKGEFYLTIQPKHCAEPVYIARKGTGFFKPVSKDTIAAFLPAPRSSAESQGVEKEIVTRDYSLNGIAGISINGQRYRVRHPKQVA